MTADPLHHRSFLREALAKEGIRPLTSLGQNFLVDGNLLRFIADAADIQPDEVILEVGSGTGALTKLLAERAGHVVAVEIDNKLYEMTRKTVAPHSNVTVLHTDALGRKSRLAAAVVQAVESLTPQTVQLVSNLPYSIAPPVIMATLESALPVRQIVATVQREIADRLTAKPATSDYGYLTVTVQNVASVEVLRRLGPQVFWPRPKVHSAIVRVVPTERMPEEEYRPLKCLARALFQSRRKTIRNALRSLPPDLRQAVEDEQFQIETQVDLSARGETLSPRQVLDLARSLAHCKLTNAN